MTIDRVEEQIRLRKWDVLDPTVRAVLILALVASLATILAADTDVIRFSAVGIVLVVAPVIGWLRGTQGPELQLS
ncbi:hypothetical protein [Gordonia hydrophobica]|uniref:Uncharacterized protein n=1 Tax=Gordonia hydrophobica TaxID=40516 RepID=A0ABZ2U1A2_9ACTN|nr:hypothetical protein [Gordonia hydrophobica]MBM7368572.1 hypothetical protein [Gordonia hydrophobica]